MVSHQLFKFVISVIKGRKYLTKSSYTSHLHRLWIGINTLSSTSQGPPALAVRGSSCVSVCKMSLALWGWFLSLLTLQTSGRRDCPAKHV